MTRTAAAILFVVFIGTTRSPESAVAQPKPPTVGWGQPIPLKGVGKAVQHTPQAAAQWWADRLIADLEQFRAEVAAAKLPPAARRALTDQAQASVGKAVALDKVLEKGNRDAWYREYGQTEASLADLGKAVAQQAA